MTIKYVTGAAVVRMKQFPIFNMSFYFVVLGESDSILKAYVNQADCKG